jgi:hypothetical protein
LGLATAGRAFAGAYSKSALTGRHPTQRKNRMSLEEWLVIMADGDAYIANGGKLLDIEMQSEAVLEAVAELLPSETWLRWGRFFSAIGTAGASNAHVC